MRDPPWRASGTVLTMLRIEIVKRHDGSGVLRCTRADGSVTWQKQTKHGPFFALHDLTHFAVETALGYRLGFFGLIDQGWNLEDAGAEGGRGPIPNEASAVEKLVGLFDSERASGILWSDEEFNSFAPRLLTAGEIGRVRAIRGELFGRWSQVPPGQALSLIFDPARNANTI